MSDDLSNCMKNIRSENLATPMGHDNLAGINIVEGDERSVIDATDAHEAEFLEEVKRLMGLLGIHYE